MIQQREEKKALEAQGNESPKYETSIAEIKDTLKKGKEDLLYSLEERFLDDLVINMVFYLFNDEIVLIYDLVFRFLYFF